MVDNGGGDTGVIEHGVKGVCLVVVRADSEAAVGLCLKHFFGPFDHQRGSIAAADVSYYQDTKNYVNTLEKINNRLILAPTCGRNGGEAGVVRGRTYRPRPDRDAFTWHASRAPARLFHLTPARLSATRLASQLADRQGSGVQVAAATVLQPCCNRQSIDIVVFFGAVAGLQPCASRYAHVCIRGRTHAHMRASNPATLQPFNITYKYHKVSGCGAVAARLRLQPAMHSADLGIGATVQANILGLGYSGAARDCLIKGNLVGVGRESFRDFVVPGRGRSGGRNGGILRFLRGEWGFVGRVVLEGLAHRVESMRFYGLARLPVGLARDRRPVTGQADCRRATRPTPSAAPLLSPAVAMAVLDFGSAFPKGQRAKVGFDGRVGEREGRLVRRGTGSGRELQAGSTRRETLGVTCGVTCQ